MDELKEILVSMPEKIEEQRRMLLVGKEKMENLQEYLKSWELQQIADIADAVNEETGKPLFSNEAKRQAELAQRKKVSEEYQNSLIDLKAQKLEYDLQVILLQGMLDRQENARALARMGVA
jgi:hypothetical protein